MNSRNTRFDPRMVLDSDWRKRVWKRWLKSALVDAVKSTPPDTRRNPAGPLDASVDAEDHPGLSAVVVAPEVAPHPASVASVSPTLPPPPMPARSPTQDRDQAARRGELRARFDVLFDRISALEDRLDALGKRFTLKAAQERRQEQRLLERLETSSEVLERQALTVEAMQTTLTRVDQRLERLERRLRYDPADANYPEHHESRVSRTAATNEDELADLQDAFGEEMRTGSRSVFPDGEATPFSGSSIHGDLSEMSLPTVLAMLELERRTGLLKVCSEDGQLVTATLRTGCIVGAKRSEVDADPVEVLGQAMRFKNGHFWFRQSSVEVVSGPPRSVGSVLLEATSRNDEAARVG